MIVLEQKKDTNPLGRNWRSSLHKMKIFISQRHITYIQLLTLLIVMFILLITLTRQRMRFNLEIKLKDLEKLEFGEPIVKNMYNDFQENFKRPYNLLSMEQLNEAKIVFEKRKIALENMCKFYNEEKANLGIAISNIIIDMRHKVSWCPIYKVASSTWMKHFATFGGVLSDPIKKLIEQNMLQLNTIVRQTFPNSLDTNETLQKLTETKKFIIVRHPHERLLSAYRDKLEHITGREYYYKRFGRRIVRKYRLDKDRNSTRLEPTFTEFLQFIAQERFFDEHWAPFESTCKPCSIHYDYILKLESLNRDQQFFIQETNLYNHFNESDGLKSNNPKRTTTRALVEKYFMEVPRELLEKINNIYEKDFKLFSYVPVTYISKKLHSKTNLAWA